MTPVAALKCVSHVTINALEHVAELQNEQGLNTAVWIEDLLNVTLQPFALGIPILAIDLVVLDANVIETDGDKWRFL